MHVLESHDDLFSWKKYSNSTLILRNSLQDGIKEQMNLLHKNTVLTLLAADLAMSCPEWVGSTLAHVSSIAAGSLLLPFSALAWVGAWLCSTATLSQIFSWLASCIPGSRQFRDILIRNKTHLPMLFSICFSWHCRFDRKITVRKPREGLLCICKINLHIPFLEFFHFVNLTKGS